MAQRVIVQQVGTTLDLLLWRAYGRAGQTSAMLALTRAANPGLSRQGAILPLLSSVVIPDLPTRRASPARAAVNLFGDV